MTSPSTSLTSRPSPRWPQPQGGDLDLGDLALDLSELEPDLNLDDFSLALKTVMMVALGSKVASHPRQEVASGRKATSHPQQELIGNLMSWLQLWFCSTLHHLACALQLNRSSIDAYVAYDVCSRIFAMPILGSDLWNSVSGLYFH
jgi:hypothetical protein